MVARKSILVLLVLISIIFAMIIFGFTKQRDHLDYKRLLDDSVGLNQARQEKNNLSESYGKIRVPADVSIDLVDPKQAGAPITLVVSASSKVPARSGVMTLKIPEIGEDPNREEILWSGSPSDLISETLEYTIETLPEGQYRLIVIFRFMPDRENAKELALSRSLYVDVRPDTILSSNISFTQIKRLELKKELEERVVVDLLKEKRQPTTPDIIRLKIAELKASDPNLIETKIAELIATDPNITRRILQLHREKADISVDPNEVKPVKKVQLDANGEPIRIISPPASGGKPTVEKAVPIPIELKKLLKKESNKVLLDENGEPIRTPSPSKGGKPTVEEPVPVPERLKSLEKKN